MELEVPLSLFLSSSFFRCLRFVSLIQKKKKNLASNPGWEINPARQRSPAPVQGHAQQYQEAPTHSLAAFAVGSVLLSSALVTFLFLTELKMLS